MSYSPSMTDVARPVSGLSNYHPLDEFYANAGRALPKMARKAVSPELKQAFETHLDETKGQIERLEKVFATVDRKPTSSRCEAMAGIIEEGQSVMEEDADDTVMDALHKTLETGHGPNPFGASRGRRDGGQAD